MSIGRNDYQDRREARIDRLEAHADKAKADAAAEYQKSHDLVKDIPFGQPNIIGRPALPRLRERSAAAMDRALAHDEKASYYADRARAAANNRAISSDDPDALDRLADKLAALEAAQERDKARNAYYRKHKTMKGFPGLSDDEAVRVDAELAKEPERLRRPVPAWALSNRNAEINRLKKRMESLRRVDDMEHVEIEFDGGRIVTNEDINRVQILFDEKPDEETRRTLKSYGFRWAPSESAWQTQRTPAALRRAKYICKVQDEKGGTDNAE